MNIPQLTALCLRYQGVLLDASEEVVHVAVVDAPSNELLDALRSPAGRANKWKVTPVAHNRHCP